MSLFQTAAILYLQDRGPCPGPQKHWTLYRDAYLSRPAQALSESILERVATLFGLEFLQSLLADYLREEAPQHPIMVECLRGFLPWLNRQGWEQSHPELCDLVRLSLMRWDVLIGPDPGPFFLAENPGEAELQRMVLQKNHALLIAPRPIYDLWMAGDPARSASEELWVAERPQAVLFYKSSATVLETLLIPGGLEPFAQALDRGLSLAESLAHFLETAVDEESVAALPGMIAHLQATGAWEEIL